MNREAAALGVPVYSIFRGRIGAVDTYLAEQRRLTLIESFDEIRGKIHPIKRRRQAVANDRQNHALTQIMAGIDSVMSELRSPKQAPAH
jgi:uncharacterized protein